MKTNLVIEAARFAAWAHRGKTRKFGPNPPPAFTHIVRVAQRVMLHPAATECTVAAAYLHDVVEECGVNPDTLTDLFGKVVTALVHDLTNRRYRTTRAANKALAWDRLHRALTQAKLIKLIDRIDNLTDPDLPLAPLEFRRLYSFESLQLADVLTDVDEELHAELRRAATALGAACDLESAANQAASSPQDTDPAKKKDDS